MASTVCVKGQILPQEGSNPQNPVPNAAFLWSYGEQLCLVLHSGLGLSPLQTTFFTDVIVSGGWRKEQQDLTEEKEHWASRKKIPQTNHPEARKKV